ncbi:MAG: response regulator [Gammaproteobacteria bacterium]|nr:response regulator [Gammaproteobacteria bacterium]
MADSANAGCVLLVEDNADDEELMRLAFESGNVMNPLVVVRDGVEALDFLFRTGAHAARDPDVWPQLVLLDLKLPKVSGLDVLRRIRSDERTRTLPVVVLTSSKQEEDVVRSYELGANAYVRKPVEFAEFLDAAKQLGMFWLMLNQPPPRKL